MDTKIRKDTGWLGICCALTDKGDTCCYMMFCFKYGGGQCSQGRDGTIIAWTVDAMGLISK
jgi:hypothetical protein